MEIINRIKNINWKLLLIPILSSILIVFLLIKFTVLTIIGLSLYLLFMGITTKKVKLFKK